jgi:hypothetical protein
MAEHQPIYKNNKSPTVVVAAAFASIGLLLLTIAVAVDAWMTCDPTFLYIVGAVWAVGPPSWFWYEYFYLFPKYGDPDGFERLKYGQQVAVAIWAGVALAVFALLSSEHFKPEKTAAVPVAVSCPPAKAQSAQ